MKNSCFTLDVPRFLRLSEARPVICNGLSIFLVSLIFHVFLKKNDTLVLLLCGEK